jgi:hypothetical protein
MSNGNYSLIVDGSQIPLRRIENIRLVTPARNEHPAAVASRLAKSSRLAIDPTYPPDLLVIWGEKQKLEQVRSYPDIQNTRAAFQDPEGNLLVLMNDILIGFLDGSSNNDRERLLGKFNGRIIQRKAEFWKFRVNDPGDDVPLLLANELSSESMVNYAEPNAVQAATFHQLPQNEPRFGKQWHLRNTGQNGGTAGADVNALGAWAITTGNPNVRIVVHDTGVDINHPDLHANIEPGRDFDNDDDDATNNSQFENGLDFVAPSSGGTLRIETTDVQGAAGYNTAQGPQLVVANFGYDAGGWRVEKHPRFLADLTGDGRADIVGFGNAWVWVALNNGNGTFQAPQLVVANFGYDAGGWRIENHPRFLADLTGDGRADIVGFGNAGVWVALNNGNGTFQAPQLVVPNFGYNAGGWRVENHPRFLADLTGDGRADIVGFGDAGVWVALNNGNGTFQAPQLVVPNFGYNAGGWRVEKHPRFLADLTGDGRADLAGFGDIGVWVAFNNGNGTFGAPQMVISNFAYGAGGWRVEKHPRFLADLTGDGRADIVGFGDVRIWFRRA